LIPNRLARIVETVVRMAIDDAGNDVDEVVVEYTSGEGRSDERAHDVVGIAISK